ncbi:MAG: chain length determinant protein EpsF [Pseudomonadota bacterium]
MTFSQLLTILKARWKTIAAFVGVFLLLALTLNLVLPKKYTATATLVVNVTTPDLIDGYGPLGAAGAAGGYMSTQMDIINSEQVARRVVRAMRLDQNAGFREQWRETTDGKGNFESWAARFLQKNLDARPTRDSNVVNINYASVDPTFSEVLANAFANAYIETSIELKTAPAKQYNSFFDARAKQLKEAVEQAQAKLSNFQTAKGMIGSDERLDVETARLNGLAANLIAMQGQSADTSSRQAASLRNPDQVQDVLGNGVISALKTDMSRQEARLTEISAKLGDAHPEVVQLRANISEVKRKIDQETARVTGGVRVNNTISKAREAEVATAYEAQRQKLLKLKEDRDTAAVLIKDVEAAQRAYDTILARLSQASLTSLSNQTNVAMLTAAVEPDTSSSPMYVLNVIIGTILGLLLGVGGAVVRELSDRCVRSLADISDVLGMPILGEMPDNAGATRSRKWPLLNRKTHDDAMSSRLLGSRSPALPAK